jgi:general stress protein YciG
LITTYYSSTNNERKEVYIMANKNAAANLTREARSKGGSMSSGNFKYDRQRASIAGQKGGRSTHKKATTS